MSWVPAFRDLIKDSAVKEEFDRLAKFFKAAKIGVNIGDAEGGLDDGNTILTRPTDDAGGAASGQRWLIGPWLLGPEGNVTNNAVLRPPTITTTQNNYAPIGIDTCVGLELESSAAVTITGIRVAARQRRLLKILNRGNFTITFPHNSSGSIAAHRFGFGAAGESVALPSGRAVWLDYDVGSELWRLFALPPVPFSGLPPSLIDAFPPIRNWWTIRAEPNPSGDAIVGVGITAPGTTGTLASNSQTDSTYVSFTSGAVIGNSAGWFAERRACQPQHDPTLVVYVRTGSTLAAVRIFVGFNNQAAGFSDTDTLTATDSCCFRYSTVASDPGWVGLTNDGVGDATITGLVAAIAVDTNYKLKIRKSGTSVFFSVNDGTEVEATADLPAATATLGVGARLYTQAGVAKAFSFSRAHCLYGT